MGDDKMIVTRYASLGNTLIEEQIEWSETTSDHPNAKMLKLPGQTSMGIYLALSVGNPLSASGNVTNDFYEKPVKPGVTLLTKQEYLAVVAEWDALFQAERQRIADEARAAQEEQPALTAAEINALRALLGNNAIPAALPTADDLSRVAHVGKVTGEKLNAAGVFTFKQLAGISLSQWLSLGRTSEGNYQAMIESAKALAAK